MYCITVMTSIVFHSSFFFLQDCEIKTMLLPTKPAIEPRAVNCPMEAFSKYFHFSVPCFQNAFHASRNRQVEIACPC